jgi:hypothetical protein
MDHRIGLALAIAGLVVTGAAPARSADVAPGSAHVVSQEHMQNVVGLRDVNTHDGVVTGEIVNRSAATVREVKLRVRHDFLWNDERHPGPESPSRIGYVTLVRDVRPGATKRFRFEMQPLPERPDGRFVTSVEVASAETLDRPAASAR